MINKGQCFVRALNKDDKWDSVDVLNLDDESFRRFIISALGKMGIIAYIIVDDVEDEPLRERKL